METTTPALTNCTLEGARNGSCYNYTISNDYEYEMVLKDDARVSTVYHCYPFSDLQKKYV